MRDSEIRVGQVLESSHFEHSSRYRVLEADRSTGYMTLIDVSNGANHRFWYTQDDRDDPNWEIVSLTPQIAPPAPNQLKLTVTRPKPVEQPATTVTITMEDLPLERVKYLKEWLNGQGADVGYVFSRLRDALNATDL